jgi:tellurite methyltransferase
MPAVSRRSPAARGASWAGSPRPLLGRLALVIPQDAASDWDARYSGAEYRYGCEPNPWLAAHTELLRPPGRALDLACGEGRDAVYLATLGFDVEAIDASTVALAKAERLATRRGVHVDWRRVDLEGDYLAPAGNYALITCHNFLHRPLLAALPAALRPAGVLIYATFLEGQEVYGRPSNPDHLLRRGELLRICAGLEVLDHYEGLTTYRDHPAYRAAIVARKRGCVAEEPTGDERANP